MSRSKRSACAPHSLLSSLPKFHRAFLILLLTLVSYHVSPAQISSSDLVQFPNAETELIAGPQLKANSALNPFPLFDSIASSRGLLNAQAFPSLPPLNLSGSLSVSNGSVIVTGNGTKFTSEIDPFGPAPLFNGRLRIRDADGSTMHVVQVLSVQSDNQLILSAPWPYSSVSATAADTYYQDTQEGWNFDSFINRNYYDLALCLYIQYYRSGDERFLLAARRIADAWWKASFCKEGTERLPQNWLPPRSISLGGLMLRALDGRPEMWDWINTYVRYQFNHVVMEHVNDTQFYAGARESGYLLLYAAWLAKVMPDSYPLAGGAMATDGTAIRAAYLSNIETAALKFYTRVQYADGSWRWDDPYQSEPDGGTLKMTMQPFMVGLLLEGMVAVHRVTQNSTVKAAVQASITKACENLFNVTYRKDEAVADMPGKKWRSQWYYYYGGTTVNPNLYAQGGSDAGARIPVEIKGDVGLISSQRQLNSTVQHVFGYAYRMTGEEKYRMMGEEMMDAGFGNSDGVMGMADSNYSQPKAYAMNYRAAGKFLAWRAEGAPIVTPTPSPSPTPTPTASGNSVLFLKTDAATQGDWRGVYGSEGYNIANDVLSYPVSVQVTTGGQEAYTWNAQTADVRALHQALASGRIASTWYSYSNIVIDLKPADGRVRLLALYCLDWDNGGRAQKFELFDGDTGTFLESRTVDSFYGGKYMVWRVSGHIRIRVTGTAGPNTVVSGIFLDQETTPTPTPTPTPSPSPSPSSSPTPTPTPTPTPVSPALVSLAYQNAAALASSTTVTVAQIDSLVANIERANDAFQLEASRFASADLINTELLAALYFARAAGALASAEGASIGVENRLQICAYYLEQAQSHMLPGSPPPTPITNAHALGANATPVIGPAATRSSASLSATLAPASLGTITGDAAQSPLAVQTVNATFNARTPLPYELAGVSVTVGGRAAPLLFVSPSRVDFCVPQEVRPGEAEVIVTSQDGYVSRGTMTVAQVAPALFSLNGQEQSSSDLLNNGPALNEATCTTEAFDVTTAQNFGADKRTRLLLLATGLSSGAANTDQSNDVRFKTGVVLANLAESVRVEAQTTDGRLLQLPVEYAGAQGALTGMDQVNVILTPDLRGAGRITLRLIVAGERSNDITVQIK